MRRHSVELRRIAPQTQSIMDKDRVKGSAISMGGNARQAADHLTDSKRHGEGKMDQSKGTIQNAIGRIKDALKGRP